VKKAHSPIIATDLFGDGQRRDIGEPISPELALVDPDLARRARALLPERPRAASVATAAPALGSPPPPQRGVPTRARRTRAVTAFAVKLAAVAVIVLTVGRAGAAPDDVGPASNASTRFAAPTPELRNVATPQELRKRRLAPYSELALFDVATGRIRTVIASAGTRTVEGPSWSPDGRRIVVVTQPCSSCRARLATVTTSGRSAMVRLKGLDANDRPSGRTAWSPDGREILFAVSGSDGERELWRARSQEWRARPLASGDEAEQPAWSPDGKIIAYAAEVNEIHRIFFIPARGGSARVVTRGASADQPTFSPNGRRLAFVRLDQSVAWDLCTLTMRTRTVHCLTHGRANERDPSWSPSDARLVFASDRAGGTIGARSLYVIRSDGSGLKRLTGPSIDAAMPAWSPDGRSIAFVLRPILGGRS
jgi:dipeptidyl aminopeptidase/acylaminoacyl peptidase